MATEKPLSEVENASTKLTISDAEKTGAGIEDNKISNFNLEIINKINALKANSFEYILPPINENSSFDWNQDILIDNTASNIILTMPEATENDINKMCRITVFAPVAVHNLRLNGFNESDTINGITGSTGNLIHAIYSKTQSSGLVVLIRCLGVGVYGVQLPDFISSGDNYKLETHNIVTNRYEQNSLTLNQPSLGNFLTDKGDWSFALKMSKDMVDDSTTQMMFGSQNYGISWRGDGVYIYAQNSSSGYLISTLEDINPANNYWILLSYNYTSNTYSAWVNGSQVSKIVNNSTGGNTAPTTTPTRITFGLEPTSATGYHYALRQFALSNMIVFDKFLTDAEAGELLVNVKTSDDISESLRSSILLENIVGVDSMISKTGNGLFEITNPADTDFNFIKM